MPKFFVDNDSVLKDSIIIKDESVNHIKNVLRLRIGDQILVSDSNQNDYLVDIEKIEKDFIITRILTKTCNLTEPKTDLTLFQAIPKSDKMDFIVQKSVELGVNCIVPVITERTVVKIGQPKDYIKKIERWQKIALEAAKQSQRGRIPRVNDPILFEQAINLSEDQIGIIAYEAEKEKNIKQVMNDSIRRIALFIGSEGGFTEKEVELAVLKGIKPITLGPRILRTETASIVAISIIMHELGEI